MPSPELKPCPFCGGEAKVIFGGTSLGVWPIVQCQSCGANLPTDKPRIGQTEKQVSIAVAAWNRRAGEEADNDSSGLATGARILRKCRNSSRIGAIHPWRRLLARILFLPLFVGGLLLWYFGRLCEWLSNLSGLVEEFADGEDEE